MESSPDSQRKGEKHGMRIVLTQEEASKEVLGKEAEQKVRGAVPAAHKADKQHPHLEKPACGRLGPWQVLARLPKGDGALATYSHEQNPCEYWRYLTALG